MTSELSTTRPKDYAESEGGIITHSPAAVRAKTEGGGASIVQVEMGISKSAAVLLWLCAFVSAAALIGLCVAWFAYGTMTSHVNVLQYDLAQMRAQLEAQGLYDPTAH